MGRLELIAMIHKILVGYNGSDSAMSALSFAVRLARVHGAELHAYAQCAVTVIRPPKT